ncbi:hypothetical protein [Nocardia farcinica]|uniref:Uncharacterized protein n=1 Tax=Nocardia farcinica (strain IFM 10152) TaxID=247156 RepID=Q5YSH5_NOCFA|nr:hypothetical protein [Nocardia farcinica]BAD58866.1 hypothetical protein NFA_40180 [Nocardia farcinica IFM 10152]
MTTSQRRDDLAKLMVAEILRQLDGGAISIGSGHVYIPADTFGDGDTIDCCQLADVVLGELGFAVRR